jgi:hypothetical protein
VSRAGQKSDGLGIGCLLCMESEDEACCALLIEVGTRLSVVQTELHVCLLHELESD